jgi:hypothetical protein
VPSGVAARQRFSVEGRKATVSGGDVDEAVLTANEAPMSPSISTNPARMVSWIKLARSPGPETASK